MPTQSCPNCQKAHDVAVYVTGQRVLCGCGIRFEVKRTDAAGPGGQTMNLRPSAARPRPSAVPTVAPAAVEPVGVDLPLSGAAAVVAAPQLNELAPGAAASLRLDRTMVAMPRIDIPGFQLTELLGRGGMGEVWRAHQVSLGRTVAVKLLPEDLAKDEEFVRRFEKESAALAALSHPHIIQIIDRGSSGGHYYFVMEFVEGRSLRELITARRPSPQESLKLLAQILRAIESAHEKEIIHRDLKPENILLDGRGHVKVADFGLAGMRGGEERLQLTATAVAMGTINYMAPEQRRDARGVDARADLYSVGVIFYELLTGELPIGRFRNASEKVEGLDKRLDDVVGKLLEAEPAQRFGSATEVLAAIEPFLGSGVVTPVPAASGKKTGSPPTQRLSRSSNREVVERGFRGLRNGLMVIGALAVVGFGARFFFGGGEAPKVTISGGGKEITISSTSAGKQAQPRKLQAAGNTYGEVFSAVTEAEAGGRTELGLDFAEGDEELNVHAGEWRLEEGRLSALQAGNVPAEGKALIPRAYLAHRYFSADDFEAEVDVNYRDIADRYEVGEDVQRFAELAFRITGTQVSAFAIPGVGMRLGWRYFTPDGVEVSGNSARDLELMIEDEMPAPADQRTFRLRLRLKKVKGGVDVTASVNGRAFAHKVLPGLQGQVAKVALGCRNYQCTFDDLAIRGKAQARPKKKVAEQGQ